MKFCLLGSLLVRTTADAEVTIAPGKQRVLLATLLLHANRVVPSAELADALWNWQPPRSAGPTIRNYVKRLRHVLGDTGRDLIRHSPGGYLIQISPPDLDLARFEELERAGREAETAGDWQRAADLLRAALAQWRGEPLADVPSEWLATRELPRLSELRLRALELCIGLDLRLGRRAGSIAELRLLTRAYPLRERLHGLLMLALCHDERRAEALAAYQDARAVLNAELGTEPGPELRQLHQRILAADPALSAPRASVCPAAPPMPRMPPAPVPPVPRPPVPLVPHQLPPALPRLAGRCEELATLRGMTSDDESAIVVVTGAPGVGKTATTLRLAHDLASRFPDGQLHADLRGYGRGGPVSARDVLGGFLRSLGVAGIPLTEAERAATFRSAIAGSRMLIALDDAGCAGQVRPLLPAAPGCTVLITSRDPLAALVIEHGARRLDLDRPSLADAVGLLQSLIGDRVEEDPASARALALQCARLPLALCLAAELAATRPAAPLATLARELAARQGRLELLDACTDQRFTLRAAFAASYQRLDRESARVFRIVGLLPGAHAEPYTVAVMTGITVAAARRALTVLARAHLIQPVGPVRYRMHGLLQAYAAELALATGDRLPAVTLAPRASRRA